MEADRRSHGFTLIELLIVVAIIGILAAIAVPNLLNALNRAKQKRTMADMRTIATAWEARAVDNHEYSVSAASTVTWPAPTLEVTAIAASLAPTYVAKLPLYDGWSRTFKVGIDASGDSYSVASFGADGTQNITATSSPQAITTHSFDCDIIFSGGVFVVYPEGVQGQ